MKFLKFLGRLLGFVITLALGFAITVVLITLCDMGILGEGVANFFALLKSWVVIAFNFVLGLLAK